MATALLQRQLVTAVRRGVAARRAVGGPRVPAATLAASDGLPRRHASCGSGVLAPSWRAAAARAAAAARGAPRARLASSAGGGRGGGVGDEAAAGAEGADDGVGDDGGSGGEDTGGDVEDEMGSGGEEEEEAALVVEKDDEPYWAAGGVPPLRRGAMSLYEAVEGRPPPAEGPAQRLARVRQRPPRGGLTFARSDEVCQYAFPVCGHVRIPSAQAEAAGARMAPTLAGMGLALGAVDDSRRVAAVAAAEAEAVRAPIRHMHFMSPHARGARACRWRVGSRRARSGALRHLRRPPRPLSSCPPRGPSQRRSRRAVRRRKSRKV